MNNCLPIFPEGVLSRLERSVLYIASFQLVTPVSPYGATVDMTLLQTARELNMLFGALQCSGTKFTLRRMSQVKNYVRRAMCAR